MDSYKSLVVWQVADELAHKVYDATQAFPDVERFCLTSQLRRAAISVPVNIVEGFARQSQAELRRFTGISLGSFAELEYLLSFADRRRFLSEADRKELVFLLGRTGSLLWRFYKSL